MNPNDGPRLNSRLILVFEFNAYGGWDCFESLVIHFATFAEIMRKNNDE